MVEPSRSNGPIPQNLRKDALYVYFAYTLRYLSVLLLIPYYGRVLGPASYGRVLAAMSLMALVWMVVNFGFSTTGSREMAFAENESLHGGIFGRQIAARLLLLPVGALIGLFGTLLSPSLKINPWYGVIATALGMINGMNLGWFYQGLRRFKLSVFFEAMSYPLNVILVYLLVKNSDDGIYALLALFMSTGITALCSYSFALRHLSSQEIVLKGGIGEIRSGSTIFLQSVNSMLMTSGSTYFLSALSTSEQVGYFGSVEKLISFALAFLQPAAQVLTPTIAHRSRHDTGNLQRLVRKGIIFEVAYGLCACVSGFFLASFVVPLAFGASFGRSIPMMRIMICALPFAAFTHAVGSYVLIPHKNERWLVLSLMIGNALNLLLIALFARSDGGIAVAIARVAGESLTAVVLAFCALRLAKQPKLPATA